MTADFSTRDPSRAEFWDERYGADFMPWDAQGVPAALIDYVERARPAPRVLVPGCGSAYEAGFLYRRGFEVTAIDISPRAIERARGVLGAEVADRVLRQADFFTLAGPFDWIYERALLCALPPSMWSQYAAAAERLLAPGGRIAGFFFIDDAVPDPRRGPPFASRAAEIDAVFAAGFSRGEQRPVEPGQSIAVFAGHEHWIVWQRRESSF
jgi:SAM-dependent methyltransferase